MTVRAIGPAVAIVLAAATLGACAEEAKRAGEDRRPSSTTTRAAEPDPRGKQDDRGPRECEPTPADQLGPFYEPGAPQRDSVGSGYVLTGAVLAANDCRPLEGARLELWLANEQGEYDDAHRGTLRAGAGGRYRFESNRPPPYGGRPAHIHVRVTPPGGEAFVTQHYPEGGERATFDLVVPAR